MAKVSKERKQECRDRLLELLSPGDTVHTVLRHVSRSGMSRRIDLFKLTPDGPRYLTAYVADLCGYSLPRQGSGLRADGCGMDMGFDVVYNLSYALFQPPGRFETDGGYALRQEWL